MKLLAIIPAKGASVRIRKKNIVDFFGKPLIDYTIESAIKAGIFNDIIVSSEDDEVLNAVKKHIQIKAMERPEELSVDPASAMDVCNFVLDKTGDNYDYVFIMLPTTPLRSAEDIKNVSRLLNEKRPDSIISVTDFMFHPVYSYICDENGCLSRAFPENAHLKSNEAPKYVVDNGGIYALKPSLIRKKLYCSGNTLPYHMPVWASIDIDSPEDLEMAKAMYSYFVKGIRKNGI